MHALVPKKNNKLCTITRYLKFIFNSFYFDQHFIPAQNRTRQPRQRQGRRCSQNSLSSSSGQHLKDTMTVWVFDFPGQERANPSVWFVSTECSWKILFRRIFHCITNSFQFPIGVFISFFHRQWYTESEANMQSVISISPPQRKSWVQKSCPQSSTLNPSFLLFQQWLCALLTLSRSNFSVFPNSSESPGRNGGRPW